MKLWKLEGPRQERLTIQEAATPTAGYGEVVVRVTHASLNARDLFVLKGRNGEVLVRDPGTALKLKETPFLPLSDVAGEVVACGAGVTRFEVKDRVISAIYPPGWIDGPARHPPRKPYRPPLLDDGIAAQYLARFEHYFVKAPATLDAAAASTLPCAGVTAWFSLAEAGRIKAGQTVLVQGTGGVALFAIQIARALGATVIVTSSDDAKLERAKALGAHYGINRSKQDWAEAALQLTQGRGVDLILEVAGGPNIAHSLRAVAYGGQISVVGLFEGFDIAGSAHDLMRKRATIRGDGVGHLNSAADLVAAVDSMGLKPVIDKSYPFEALPEALGHLEKGPFGKIVIELPV